MIVVKQKHGEFKSTTLNAYMILEDNYGNNIVTKFDGVLVIYETSSGKRNVATPNLKFNMDIYGAITIAR